MTPKDNVRRPRRLPKRLSVIEVLPDTDDEFYESAITSILQLLSEDITGSIFIQRDRGPLYRLTLERVLESRE